MHAQAARCQRGGSIPIDLAKMLTVIGPISELRDAGRDMPSDAATLLRLLRSRHVSDLRLATGLCFWVFVFGSIAISLILPDIAKRSSGTPLSSTVAAIGSLGFAVLVFMGWIYRAASARLGIVDLFAYEISTICRVGNVVDSVMGYINDFDRENRRGREQAKEGQTKQGQTREGQTREGQTREGQTRPGEPAATGGSVPATVQQSNVPYRFSSSENYFPVFESNSRDLRLLEAGVVTNVTAFYTFMKVVRDFLRHVSHLNELPMTAEVSIRLQQARINMIYMLFLAYEAARRSLNDLIEYEPTHAEATIVILLSEIPAYRFLIKQFKDDDRRRKRLRLRIDEYETTFKMLYAKMFFFAHSEQDDREWKKAAELWPDLVHCARDARLRIQSPV